MELQRYLDVPAGEKRGSWLHWNLGLGGEGSGASFHFHAKAVNLLVSGRKRWFLQPPAQATYSTVPIFEWLQHGDLNSDREENTEEEEDGRAVEFIQHPGDIIILPRWIGHATACIEDCVSLSHVMKASARHRTGNPAGPFEDSPFSAREHRDIITSVR